MKSIFRIEFEGKNYTGSFVQIYYKYKTIYCLLTTNKILNDNFIKNNKEINLFLTNGKKVKKIEINKENIKYVNNPYNVAIIEINKDEEFNDYLNVDELLLDDYDNFKGLNEIDKNNIEEEEEDYPKDFYRNKSIYIPYYRNKNIFVSFGLLKDFNDFEIIHFCNIKDDDNGPLGAPILDLENKKVIGIYNHEKKLENQRFGIFLEEGAKEFIDLYSKNIINNKNNLLRFIVNSNNNFIKLKLNVDEDMLNKEVYFLDNYLDHNHLKELNQKNVELKINGEKVKYKKSFIPKKCENEILIEFKKPLKNCGYMFCSCKYIIDIDLSLFDTSSTTNMEYMFAFCDNLVNIDFSYLDTKKVDNMSNMFFNCYNLERIKLCYLGNENTNMENIFEGCKKFKILDLSELKAQDDFDINMFSEKNKNLETIIINKECIDKFKNCSLNIEYI
jgi:surface protein